VYIRDDNTVAPHPGQVGPGHHASTLVFGPRNVQEGAEAGRQDLAGFWMGRVPTVMLIVIGCAGPSGWRLGCSGLGRAAFSCMVRWLWTIRADPLRPWRGLDLQFSQD